MKLKDIILAGGITLAGILFPSRAHAQDDITKIVSEITWAPNNSILKFRPFDNTSPSGTRKTDLALGEKIGDSALYCYYSYDNRDRSWIGARIDF